jgi:hypothetical protein
MADPIDPRFGKPSGQVLYGCTRCCHDFSSLRAFDAHQVGDVNVPYRSTGPETHHGFRCLPVDDEPDWIQDVRGRWTTTAIAAQAKKLRDHHADHALGAATDALEAEESAA